MIGEILGLSALVATNAGISIGIYKYFNSKIGRVYGRLDENKEKTDTTYVRKELCEIQHTQNAQNLTGLELRINERFSSLEKEVRSNFGKLIELLTKT